MAVKVNAVVIRADAEPADGSVTLDKLGDDVIDEIAGAGAGGVPTTRTITAGAGLTGGGDLSANRTLSVGAGTGITVNADDVAVDPAVVALRTYVDDVVQGFTAKGAARVALMATTLAALLGGMTYNAGTKRLTANANGAIGTVDGVADLDAGDLVMIPALTGADAIRSGPYYVVQAGDGSTPVILQRAANFDATADVKAGSYVLIADEDSDHNGWLFHLVTEGPYVLDTTQLEWAARQINIILSGTNPAALGNAAPGTSEEAARADHVHPTTGLVTTSATASQTVTASDNATGVTRPVAVNHESGGVIGTGYGVGVAFYEGATGAGAIRAAIDAVREAGGGTSLVFVVKVAGAPDPTDVGTLSSEGDLSLDGSVGLNGVAPPAQGAHLANLAVTAGSDLDGADTVSKTTLIARLAALEGRVNALTQRLRLLGDLASS